MNPVLCIPKLHEPVGVVSGDFVIVDFSREVQPRPPLLEHGVPHASM